jgi:hypothetical protein
VRIVAGFVAFVMPDEVQHSHHSAAA